MNSLAVRAIPRAGAPAVARPKNLDRALARFPVRVQPRVRALAARHPRLADLARSFPALLFALAVPNGMVRVEPLIRDVISGRDLKSLAERAGIALWMRKLQPEMLGRPLPALPMDALFSMRIVNHIPRDQKRVADWLDAVAFAVRWGHEDFAIWYARNFPTKPRLARRLTLLALWAWFSEQAGTRAHGFLEKPWNPHIQYKAALDAANDWLLTVDLYANLGDGAIADMWLDPGSSGGYDFVPLVTASDVLEEARAMKNCLRTYGSNIVHRHSRFWSMRKDGARVATVQIGRHRQHPLIDILELQAEQNRQAPFEVWRAADRWLRQQNILNLIGRTPLEWNGVPLDRGMWFALWKPYWLAKKAFPSWLPLMPSRDALEAL